MCIKIGRILEIIKQHEINKFEEQRFTCQDCGIKDYKMYMVNDDLWEKYGNQNFTLCKTCLEKRMARNLTKKDIFQYKDTMVNLHNHEMRDLKD